MLPMKGDVFFFCLEERALKRDMIFFTGSPNIVTVLIVSHEDHKYDQLQFQFCRS